eukprot:scaffold14275_cov107-Isochrysis_galbana.AAC.7
MIRSNRRRPVGDAALLRSAATSRRAPVPPHYVSYAACCWVAGVTALAVGLFAVVRVSCCFRGMDGRGARTGSRSLQCGGED